MVPILREGGILGRVILRFQCVKLHVAARHEKLGSLEQHWACSRNDWFREGIEGLER
jgi:hypothetical protein